MGSSFYGNASAVSPGAIEDMIIISDTQPTSTQNEIWIKLNAQSVLVPTMADLEHLVSSPLVASTAAAMTDTNKVYVYTGSETGMTNGDWYYYSGNAWVSGGVYNAVAVDTDDTLSVEGMPADAKAVGDIFMVSDDQPDAAGNKVWIDSDADIVEVLTREDINALNNQVTDLKSAIFQNKRLVFNQDGSVSWVVN